MDIDYRATTQQKNFLQLDSRWKAFIGGIRSGKTHAGAIQALIYSADDKIAGNNILISGATYKMLQDAIIPKVQEVFPSAIIEDFNKSQKVMELRNGTTIYFRPFESERQIDRIRGTEFSVIWMDEAAYLPEYAFEVCQGRLTQGKKQRGYITTSPRGFNWVYEYFVDSERENYYKSIHGVSSAENPTLPDEWISDIKSSYSDEYLKQEFHGQFIKFQGLIYQEFNEDNHIIDSLDDYDIERYIYGYDAGTTHPRVFSKIAITPNDKYIVTDEMYRKNWLLSDSIERFKDAHYNDDQGVVYCDPSAANDIQEMENKGVEAKDADNDVMGGIQHIKSKLENDNLLIHERCSKTINEFHSYRWQTDKDDNLKDKPVKELDHAMDSLRYAIFTEEQGGMVLDSLEW